MRILRWRTRCGAPISPHRGWIMKHPGRLEIAHSHNCAVAPRIAVCAVRSDRASFAREGRDLAAARACPGATGCIFRVGARALRFCLACAARLLDEPEIGPREDGQ